jgi:hypothetical protein
VVEIVQAVPATLINEVALDVPQVQMVEVFKQTANATSQRIVQNAFQYERAIGREVVERTDLAVMAGVYDAGVVGFRENVSVQPTVVERLNPVVAGYTEEVIVGGGGYTEVIERAGGYIEAIETIAAPTVYETIAAPTVIETIGAPTVIETIGAPTAVEMLVAPTVYETVIQG